jgi:hypothetical protein
MKILPYLLVATLISGCAMFDSGNVEITFVKPTPLSSNSASNPAHSSTAQTPVGVETPINDSDYIITEFDSDKIELTTFASQPSEILESIWSVTPADKKNWDKVRRFKVKVEERDMNHDGISERIIASRISSTEGPLSFHIFSFDKDKRANLIFRWDEGPGDFLPKIEFLTKPNKTDFDLIKVTYEYGGDRETMKDIFYHRMQNAGYQEVECLEVENNIKKVVPCNQSER